MASQIGSLLRNASKRRKEKKARTGHPPARPAAPGMFPSLNSNPAPNLSSHGASSSSGQPGPAGSGGTSSAAAAAGVVTELSLQADGTSYTDLPRKAAWDGGNTKGGGTSADGRRPSRDPNDESNADHRIKATKAHRKWLKRHKIHDVLSASYQKSSKVPAGSNVLLYVGLSVLMLGLIISFVGLGDKGFRTRELRLIGPCLAGFGILLCVLRMFYCFPCCYARTTDECCIWPCTTSQKDESKQKRPGGQPTEANSQDHKDEQANLLGSHMPHYLSPTRKANEDEGELMLHGEDNPNLEGDYVKLPADVKLPSHHTKSHTLNLNDSLDRQLAEQNWRIQEGRSNQGKSTKSSNHEPQPGPSRPKSNLGARQSSTTSLLQDELVLNAHDLKTSSHKKK